MDEVFDKDKADIALVEKWKEILSKEESAHDEYRKQAERADKEFNKGSEFNILWSNIQIMVGALFSNRPNPEVRRRNREIQGPAKDAATIIERAIDFQVDSTDFVGTFGRVVQDYCVSAVGIPRVLYKPQIGEAVDPITQAPVEVIEDQALSIEFISWKNFHWAPCKSWEKCDWIAFDYTKSKKDIRKEYGVIVEETEDDDEGSKNAKITEILHRPSRSTIVICDQFDTPLAVREDQLNLRDFYPVPKPLMTNVGEKLTPKPDFFYYEKKAKAVNKLSKRLDRLEESVKDVGFYDAAFNELGVLETKPDGGLVPVENISEMLGDNPDLNKVIAKLPIQHTMAVVQSLSVRLDERKQEIYEITGLSDIVRGATEAQETAKAQEIKAQFGSIRLQQKQSAVAICVRDIFRIMAEIIGEHFEPDILTKMTGIEASEEVMMILRDDMLRNFSIDVETETTIARDEKAEMEQRMGALKTISEYINGILPGMMSGAVPFEVGKELLLLSIRGFKYAGNLTDIISQMDGQSQVAQLQQQMQQMGQQMEGMQAELQKRGQGDMIEQQADVGKTQAETQKTLAEAEEQKIENAANISNFMGGGPVVNMG